MANNELKRALDEATGILTTAATKLESGSENTSNKISANLRYDSYIGVIAVIAQCFRKFFKKRNLLKSALCDTKNVKWFDSREKFDH